MKIYQLLLRICFPGFFFIGNLQAQLPAIDSLIIIPLNPVSTDSVKVICYTTFPSGGCPLASSSVNINGMIITVSVVHLIGPLTYICHSTDTLTIGKLNPGNYELHYYLTDTAPPAIYDIDSIFFTVQQASGMQLIDPSDSEIQVYPNPSIEEIQIEFKTSSVKERDITIYSSFGQKIKSVCSKNDIITIDINDLPNGIYFIVIENGQGRRWVKKLIKNLASGSSE